MDASTRAKWESTGSRNGERRWLNREQKDFPNRDNLLHQPNKLGRQLPKDDSTKGPNQLVGRAPRSWKLRCRDPILIRQHDFFNQWHPFETKTQGKTAAGKRNQGKEENNTNAHKGVDHGTIERANNKMTRKKTSPCESQGLLKTDGEARLKLLSSSFFFRCYPSHNLLFYTFFLCLSNSKHTNWL